MRSKELKRERRKIDKARRHSKLLRVPRSEFRVSPAALAAAAAIAAGTQAYASPVRFDNPPGPGHFDWTSAAPGGYTFLDITEPATAQPGPSDGASTLGQITPTGVATVGGNVQIELGGYAGLFVIPHSSGQLIPTGAPWGIQGYTYYPGIGSELPAGAAIYLAVRFDPNGAPGTSCTPVINCHYGWVGVVRTGAELDAFAWGYETEVGVPIAAGAPEPGSLALLAFGAVGALSRRKRRA